MPLGKGAVMAKAKSNPEVRKRLRAERLAVAQQARKNALSREQKEKLEREILSKIFVLRDEKILEEFPELMTRWEFNEISNDVQLLASEKYLQTLEKHQKLNPEPVSNNSKSSDSKGLGNFIFVMTFIISILALLAALFHDSQTPPGCDRLIFQPPRCSTQ